MLIILIIIEVIFKRTVGIFSFSFFFLLVAAAKIVGIGGLVLGVLRLLAGNVRSIRVLL